MIVVSDTSAITSLIQVHRAELLSKLFQRVIVPTAVRDELLAFHRSLPAFLEVIEAGSTAEVDKLLKTVDRGEAEAIILAEEQSPDFVLIDDSAARSIAIGRGLPVIGLVGVLIKAKKLGALDSLRTVISELEVVAGFRMSAGLKAAALRAVNER